jgi:hypothetical protein
MATEQITEVETDEPTMINGLTLRPSVRKAWVEALRSGKYKQAKHALRDIRKDSFCCLGVLCDIAKSDLDTEWNDHLFMGADTLPPDPVLDWAGNPGRYGDGDSAWMFKTLGEFISVLNDEGCHTFAMIADLIEGKA